MWHGRGGRQWAGPFLGLKIRMGPRRGTGAPWRYGEAGARLTRPMVGSCQIAPEVAQGPREARKFRAYLRSQAASAFFEVRKTAFIGTSCTIVPVLPQIMPQIRPV